MDGAGGPTQIVGATTRSSATARRDQAELRAAVQDTVADFVRRRRAELLPAIRAEHPTYTDEQIAALLDERQPDYQDFDPVVGLALMAVDHRHTAELRRQALSDSAQYLRPKLKAVEVSLDQQSAEAIQQRDQLANTLVDALERLAAAKRASGETIEQEARDVTPRPVSPDGADTDGAPAVEDR